MTPARKFLMLIAAALATGGGAAAQTQKQAAGPYVIELSVNPRPQVFETAMLFSITDVDGKPMDTAKARGHADFSSGGLKGKATLHPDGANRMKGYGLMSAKPDLRIEVTVTFPGESPKQAVFAPNSVRD